MIFQKLIIVNFETFLLDDSLYKNCKNLRNIKILLPNAEHFQTYCLRAISLQSHENQANLTQKNKNKIKFLKPKVMPNAGQ